VAPVLAKNQPVRCSRPTLVTGRTPARAAANFFQRRALSGLTEAKSQIQASPTKVTAAETKRLSEAKLLTGSVTSGTGQKLGGVQVTVKKDGSTITTSVYTDQNGGYFFPAIADGTHRVWAQALGFYSSTGRIDLTVTRRQDFELSTIPDAEERIRQMPPEILFAALSEDSEADANIKSIFHNQCTNCHTPSYPLQFKFDEAGWNKIINLMMVISDTGEYLGPNSKANGIIEFNRK
jgi:hypothetical protein